MRTVEHWTREGRGWTLARTYRVGTRGASRKLAEKLLGTVETTRDCYWEDVRKSDFCRSYRGKYRNPELERGREKKATMEHGPEMVIVPSVYERGVW